MNTFPIVKGSIISFKHSCGISPRTKWEVVSHIDKKGFAKIKSLGNGKRKTVLLDGNKLTGGVNPSFNDDILKKIKIH